MNKKILYMGCEVKKAIPSRRFQIQFAVFVLKTHQESNNNRPEPSSLHLKYVNKCI